VTDRARREEADEIACVIMPRWLLAAQLAIGAFYMAAGALNLNADLSLTETISLLELLYSVFAAAAVGIMLGNLADAYMDRREVRAGEDRRVGSSVVACGNVRVELYLVFVAVALGALGILGMLQPPPENVTRSLVNGFAVALFVNLDIWTLWVSIQNRRERKFLLGVPFWPGVPGALHDLLKVARVRWRK
jgi:hypothetical protein